MIRLLITVSFTIILLSNNLVLGQTKIGYINFSEVVKAIPEANDVKNQIDAYSKQFLDHLNSMVYEFQTNGSDKTDANMTDAVRAAKEAELADLQKRMTAYQNEAQQKVAARTEELSKPLFDKVRAAVTQVAKEKGYDYVINSSQTDLVVSPPGDDLTADTKAKLGIK